MMMIPILILFFLLWTGVKTDTVVWDPNKHQSPFIQQVEERGVREGRKQSGGVRRSHLGVVGLLVKPPCLLPSERLMATEQL